MDDPPSVAQILRPGFLARRMRADEWMDQPAANPVWLRRSLGYLRRINSLLGYTRSTLGHLERFSAGWERGRTIRILDVATGSADVPRAILKWAAKRGFCLQVVGVDLHAKTARAAIDEESVRIVQANALSLPFADDAFDYAITSLFLHHLDETDVVSVLKEMNRIASRGLIVGDLLRDRRAYGWVSLLTLAANPMVRHDGRVSVAQAFTEPEIIALRDQAGVRFAKFHRHFGHRFVLAGEKEPRSREAAKTDAKRGEKSQNETESCT